MPDPIATRRRARRLATLARHKAYWAEELKAERAAPHPSAGRHAQRLRTCAWRLQQITRQMAAERKASRCPDLTLQNGAVVSFSKSRGRFKGSKS